MIPRSAAILLILLVSIAVEAQTTVTIRPVARIEAGHRLTLDDVAQVAHRGHATDATRIGALVFDQADIAQPAATRSVTIGAEDIIRLLDSAGIPTTGISIRGNRCEVLVRPARAVQPNESSTDVVEASEETSPGPILRDHVRHRLRTLLGVQDEHLEITPDPRDTAILNTPTLGWTVEVRVTGFSRRTPLRITMYAADGTVREQAVRIGIRTQRDIVRARHQLSRGSQITLEDLVADRVWLAPDERPVSIEDAAGLMVRTRVAVGEMLTQSAVESPVVIERGSVVVVHVVSDTIVMRREARALADGRVGDMIELEPLTPSGGLLTARVESAGRALVLLQHTAGLQTETNATPPSTTVRVSRTTGDAP